MILEYKGFNNVWCFEEARHIAWANVEIVTVRQQFEERLKAEKTTEEEAALRCDFRMAVSQKIATELNRDIDTINYMIGNIELEILDNICAVVLCDRDINATYVFEQGRGVYILNSKGQTVQRIA